MNLSIFGRNFLTLIGKALEKDGFHVLFNKFSLDTDIVITQSILDMYKIYRILKLIKKNKIKLINFILDIPAYRLEKPYGPRSLYKTNKQPLFDDQRAHNSIPLYIKQYLYHYAHKSPFLFNKINHISSKSNNGEYYRNLAKISNYLFNFNYNNRITYQKNYRNYLKKADLNLSISKYTQYCVKRFLKLNSSVCYQCVDSDYLLNFKKNIPKKYDAISVGRIVERKRHEVFIEAAKSLGLNIVVVGKQEDDWIKLDCPHHYAPNLESVFNEILSADFYVDCSIFEGFGMPPVEAAYLGKIVIASDIFIHKEILGNFALYFKKDNVKDLIKKMQSVINEEFTLNKDELEKIRRKYSVQAAKNRLKKYIELII
ncbi:MAG: glycosyltransferase [Promethearchaeota archaeon]